MKSGRAFGRFTEDSDRFRATEVGRAEVVRRLDLEDETDPLCRDSFLGGKMRTIGAEAISS